MIYRIGRAARNVAIFAVLVAALALTGIRLLLPKAAAYRAELESKVGTVLGAPVKIGRLRARMSGFRPELILADIQVSSSASGAAPAIQMQEIRLGVDLLESIVSRRFLSMMRVSLVGTKMGLIRKADGSLAITGLNSGGGAPLWLLQGKRYEVLQSEVQWRSEEDGAAPLTFSDVDIVIENDHDAQRRRVHALLALPKSLGHSLRLSLDTAGDIFAPGGINGRLYAEGKGVNLPALASLRWAGPVKAAAGVADFKLWSDWNKSRMTALLGAVHLAGGEIRNSAKETMQVENFAARFAWRREQDGWQLQVKNVDLDAKDMHWRGESLGLRVFSGEDEQAVRGAGAMLPHLRVADVSRLVLFSQLLDETQVQIIRQLRPVGVVQNLAMFVAPDLHSFTFRGDFSGVGWSAFGSAPAVAGLSGSAAGNEAAGTVQLAMQAAHIEFPGLFRAALPVSHLSGKLHWLQTPQQWQLSSELLQLGTPHVEMKSRLQLQIPKGREPVFIDLQAGFGNIDNVAHIKKYFPAGIMDAEVLAWLDRAFISGKVTGGAALLRGNLQDFPFGKREGVFQVLFAVQDLELGVHPDWPNIKGVDAAIRFLQGALQADIHKGKTENVEIRRAAAEIKSLQNSNHVLLQGEAAADLRDALKYLRNTPLRSDVDPVMEFIGLQGSAEADLDLQIPIAASAAVKADGTVRLGNAQLQVLPLSVPVTAIQGAVKFTEAGLYADNIGGRALGYPVAADIMQSAGQTVVRLAGRADAGNLAAAFPSQFWQTVQGQADYQLRLAFPGVGNQPASLQLTSGLQGIALDWPGSLQKKTEQMRALNIAFGFPDGALLPVTLNYGGELLAAAYIDKQNRALHSADLVLTQNGGKAQAKLPQQPGITVAVQRTGFDLDPWLRVVEQSSSVAGGGDLLHALRLDTQRLRWQSNDLGAVAVDLQRREGRWEGWLKSGFAAGRLSAPVHLSRAEKIVLDLQMLNLAPLADWQMQGETLSPLDLPALDIDSRSLRWKSTDLGALTVRAQPAANGLNLSTVELRSKEHALNLTGRWQATGKQAFTDVKGTLQSDALGKLLEQLDITQDMQKTPGKIDITLRWPGAPYQLGFATVQGVVDAELGEGRLLGINQGLGRVLGILALDQWKRRLQLDFSDAYAEGLTYNRIGGHFEIGGGYALTDNLVIEAVPAKIEIKGQTGLVARDWNQILIVTPKTSAALPIAGTIASKLITGAVSLVANQEVVEDLKHMNSAAYQVKGKWGAAEIKPLPESDGMLRKVWTGMTDFSWLK